MLRTLVQGRDERVPEIGVERGEVEQYSFFDPRADNNELVIWYVHGEIICLTMAEVMDLELLDLEADQHGFLDLETAMERVQTGGPYRAERLLDLQGEHKDVLPLHRQRGKKAKLNPRGGKKAADNNNVRNKAYASHHALFFLPASEHCMAWLTAKKIGSSVLPRLHEIIEDHLLGCESSVALRWSDVFDALYPPPGT